MNDVIQPVPIWDTVSIWIQFGLWIQEGKNDQQHKVKSEENSCLEVLDVLVEGLKVSPIA